MKTKLTFFRINRHAALALALIAALVAVTGALAVAGALDTTFDGDGVDFGLKLKIAGGTNLPVEGG